MPGDKDREVEAVGRTFEAFGVYCVETAEIVGADQLALFLHSDELQVRPAFLCVYGRVVVAFLDEESLDKVSTPSMTAVPSTI